MSIKGYGDIISEISGLQKEKLIEKESRKIKH
jgi:hypothetical protein